MSGSPNQDSRSIERDLEATRGRLDAGIDALQQKVSPGQMVDQAMDFFKSGDGGQFGRNLMGQVRDQPIAVALVGIGLAWLATGGRSRTGGSGSAMGYEAHFDTSGLTRRDDESETSFNERAADVRGRAMGITRSVGEAGSAFVGRVERALHDASDRSRSAGASLREGLHSTSAGARDAGQSAWTAMQENPVLAAAIGITAGAALATLLPASRMEEEHLGPAIDEAADRLSGVAEQAKDVAGRAAGAAADVVREEISQPQDQHGAQGQGDAAPHQPQLVR